MGCSLAGYTGFLEERSIKGLDGEFQDLIVVLNSVPFAATHGTSSAGHVDEFSDCFNAFHGWLNLMYRPGMADELVSLIKAYGGSFPFVRVSEKPVEDIPYLVHNRVLKLEACFTRDCFPGQLESEVEDALCSAHVDIEHARALESCEKRLDGIYSFWSGLSQSIIDAGLFEAFDVAARIKELRSVPGDARAVAHPLSKLLMRDDWDDPYGLTA